MARDLFKACCSCQKAKGGAALEPEYQMEIDDRLKHMEFVVAKVKKLASKTAFSDKAALLEYEAYLNRAPHLRDLKHADEMKGYREHLESTMPLHINETEMRVLTEAFYYCAGRARAVLRDVYPGLGQFESVGVRDVRQQLLEAKLRQLLV